jgi:5-formaminoimidazole-4-carboxamide-1-beta-D-ribofuranosyl 5'-monophosphate synthetase
VTVSYEEAREIVRAHFEPGWIDGTFCLDDRSITENDEFYVFEVGAREYLVDGDFDYAIAGGCPYRV